MEVTAVWQWWNYLASHCSPEKKLLRLNLDETAVRPYMDPVRGLVVTGAEEPRGKPLRSASRRQQRTCLSHIAIVCDDTSVQPVLPQIIVGNCKAVLKKSAGQIGSAAARKCVSLETEKCLGERRPHGERVEGARHSSATLYRRAPAHSSHGCLSSASCCESVSGGGSGQRLGDNCSSEADRSSSTSRHMFSTGTRCTYANRWNTLSSRPRAAPSTLKI